MDGTLILQALAELARIIGVADNAVGMDHGLIYWLLIIISGYAVHKLFKATRIEKDSLPRNFK